VLKIQNPNTTPLKEKKQAEHKVLEEEIVCIEVVVDGEGVYRFNQTFCSTD
jgi:hypothetical protein